MPTLFSHSHIGGVATLKVDVELLDCIFAVIGSVATTEVRANDPPPLARRAAHPLWSLPQVLCIYYPAHLAPSVLERGRVRLFNLLDDTGRTLPFVVMSTERDPGFVDIILTPMTRLLTSFDAKDTGPEKMQTLQATYVDYDDLPWTYAEVTDAVAVEQVNALPPETNVVAPTEIFTGGEAEGIRVHNVSAWVDMSQVVTGSYKKAAKLKPEMARLLAQDMPRVYLTRSHTAQHPHSARYVKNVDDAMAVW
jgi:hypothetical protein